jgi:hypothetical protein
VAVSGWSFSRRSAPAARARARRGWNELLFIEGSRFLGVDLGWARELPSIRVRSTRRCLHSALGLCLPHCGRMEGGGL